MIKLHPVAVASATMFGAACISTYQVRTRINSDEWPSARVEIDHCLSSLAFRDASSEDVYLKFRAEDPAIVAVWQRQWERTFPHGRPFPVVWVREEEGALYVHFVPSTGNGQEAEFFAGTFSQCLRLHDPNIRVETTSENIDLDLR